MPPAPRHHATRPSDLRACSGCGQPATSLTYHPFARKYLCRTCYGQAPRHPNLHGPMSGAAIHHVARCPQCYVRAGFGRRTQV